MDGWTGIKNQIDTGLQGPICCMGDTIKFGKLGNFAGMPNMPDGRSRPESIRIPTAYPWLLYVYIHIYIFCIQVNSMNWTYL